ncbi:exopolyphosphatase [Agrilactobacillus yilanensis]|uniref:Exopolyphosphatase n=1 Tax=Agrilactobacillus yilanensis TaxID=2485997 RepID=A0ABW4J3P0_9LACO|nr:exopolyphosphatase [Agrilactobacillus yilanensis]
MVRKQQLYAVIVIGAQNIFMQIVDLASAQIVESVRYDIDLGEDVFSEKQIHSQTVNEIYEALQAIIGLLKDYQIKNYRCYATHSFHEAENAEYVREQLYERTGFEIHWSSESQEALYRNLATYTYMPDFSDVIEKNAILLDISSGSVALTAYKKGKFMFSKNLKLGPLRVYEVMRDVKDAVPNYVEVLKDYVASSLVDFIRLLPDASEIHNVILMGSAMSVFEPMTENSAHTLKFSIKEFDAIYSEVVHGNDQFVVKKYNVDRSDVPQVLPVMILVNQLLKSFDIQTLWVTALKLIDGMTASVLQNKQDLDISLNQKQQILTSARNIAKRYHVEEKHQDFVIKYSLQLFDRLKKLHGMGAKERLILELAAVLDDVGSYINNHNHYAHSDYIIQNSEIIGLSNVDLKMVAAVARYHSSHTPSSELKRFRDLPIDQRMIIAKLAAILRLADALDASRQQKIKAIRVSLKSTTQLVIQATANDDIELERWIFKKKGEFFESVFGVQPILKGRVKL